MSVEESIWQISVRARRAADDARGRGILAAIRRAGFHQVTSVHSTRLYQLRGRLGREVCEALARDLFADPVIDTWDCDDRIEWPASSSTLVEVHLQPGVMDPVALSSTNAAREQLSGVPGGATATVLEVRTGWRYALGTDGTLDDIDALARRVLANPCIERVFVCAPDRRDALPRTFPTAPTARLERRTVSLNNLSDDALSGLSREAHLFLSVDEMRAIRDHFRRLERDPTDLELETLAQTWSEHCVHKTMKSAVRYRGRAFGAAGDAGETIDVSYDNLLADTVARATHTLDRPWCLSVFEDNAGIIEFDERFGVAFKVETHNHPSAIEPFGGAATGAGGCIRDILGCGLGAKPVANTDVFCLANPDHDAERVSPGVLHPARVLRGVVSGVRDYGNRMGIPTVAGGLHFDNRYLGNPLVFCGCVGLIPRDRIDKGPRKGDRIVLAGGRTGRDGIGGATFSSAELTDTHADEFAHAVQIGNPIEEKKLADALMRARDHEGGCLYSSITDCGAGGLSSAVGEMGATLGAVVDLEHVPLKYSGLRSNEIWLSEAQERMVMAVSPERLDALIGVFAAEEVEASVIGTFTGDGILRVRHEGLEVGRLDVGFLHEGIPRRERAAHWSEPRPNPMPACTSGGRSADLGERILEDLGALNVRSRESIFRQYDHEVQGGTAVKPLVGVGEGPSDAAVIRPILTSMRGVALGGGLCPQVADEDPYWMAALAVDEAIRNVVCVGGDPERTAILDNFCWGGCEDDEEMGALVRACQACHDAAIAYGTPFISGKDSLNNQFAVPPEVAARLRLPACIRIPATLLISALAIVPDVRRCVTSDLKSPGNRIVHLSVDMRSAGMQRCAALHRAVAEHVAKGHVAACHDVSDGGVAVCLAEMCIGAQRGATACADAIEASIAAETTRHDSSCGYILELAADADIDLLAQTGQLVELGRVSDDRQLRLISDNRNVAQLDVTTLAEAWRVGFGMDEGA